jgi:hypothetical protein
MNLISLTRQRVSRFAIIFVILILVALGAAAMASANSPDILPVEPDGGIGGEVVLPVEPDGGIGN